MPLKLRTAQGKAICGTLLWNRTAGIFYLGSHRTAGPLSFWSLNDDPFFLAPFSSFLPLPALPPRSSIGFCMVIPRYLGASSAPLQRQMLGREDHGFLCAPKPLGRLETTPTPSAPETNTFGGGALGTPHLMGISRQSPPPTTFR